jgi:hypothetical protein
LDPRHPSCVQTAVREPDVARLTIRPAAHNASRRNRANFRKQTPAPLTPEADTSRRGQPEGTLSRASDAELEELSHYTTEPAATALRRASPIGES